MNAIPPHQGPHQGSETSRNSLNEHIAQLEKNAIGMANALVKQGLISSDFATKCLTHQAREIGLNRPISFWEIIFVFAVPEIQPTSFWNAVSSIWIDLQPMEILMIHGPITKALWREAHKIREQLRWAGKIKTMEMICMKRLDPEISEQCRQILARHSKTKPAHNDVQQQTDNTKEALNMALKPGGLQETLLARTHLNQDDLRKAHQYIESEQRRGKNITLATAIRELGLMKRLPLLEHIEENGHTQSVEEILLELGLITESQQEEALTVQADLRAKWTEKSVGDILVEKGMLSYEKLQEAIAQQNHMTRTKPRMWEMKDMWLFFLFEQEVLNGLGFLPYKISSEPGPSEWGKPGKLQKYTMVVLSNDCTGDQADNIRQEVNKKAEDIRMYMADILRNPKGLPGNIPLNIVFHYAPQKEIQELTCECFKHERILNKAIPQNIMQTKEYMDDDDIFRIGTWFYSSKENGEHINTFANIVITALELWASDIHMESEKDMLCIRARVNGVLETIVELPRAMAASFFLSIKNTFNFVDSQNPNAVLNHDGKAYYHDRNENIVLRFASIPTIEAGSMTIRLLVQKDAAPTFEQLWIRKNTIQKLALTHEMPGGVLVVCWPTWAGKTTTLYSTIERLRCKEVRILTVEDPVEYRMDWVTQIPVGNWVWQLDYSTVLPSIMRHDPDIIMYGEMRDEESAGEAMKAGQTGHKVFSTVHADSTVQAISRLLSMWVPPQLLQSTLLSVMGQRLVRKACTKCKEAYAPTTKDMDYVREHFTNWDDYLVKHEVQFYRGTGVYNGEKCDCCRGTWYAWRTLISELLCANAEIKKAVGDRKPDHEIETIARRYGMTSMQEDGFLLAIDGVTTLEEVLRVAKSSEYPQYLRTIEETRRLLEGDLTISEMNLAVYGTSMNNEQGTVISSHTAKRENGPTNEGEIITELHQGLREVSKTLETTIHPDTHIH